MRRKCHTCQIEGQLNIATLFRERCQFSEIYYCTHYIASYYRYLDVGEVCDSLCCYGCKEKDLCGYACNACKKIEPEPRYQKAPRYSWQHYGITKERYRQLTEYIQSGRYAPLVSKAAHIANKDIAEYILLSVKENLSYEGLQRLWDLKKIERMACGRSDFYGYRRYFFSIFDKELRRIEECGKN